MTANYFSVQSIFLSLVSLFIFLISGFWRSPACGEEAVSEQAESANESPSQSTITYEKSDAQRFLKDFVSNPDVVQSKAFQLFSDGKVEQARESLLAELGDARASGNTKLEISTLYFLALLERKEDDIKTALEYLRKIGLLTGKGSPDLSADMNLNRRVADCYYDDRKLDRALASYQAALISSRYIPDSDYVSMELLESISGCLQAQGKNRKALEYLLELKRLQEAHLSTEDLPSQGNYFWTLLKLSFLYGKLKETEKRDALRPQLVTMLEDFVQLRMRLEASDRLKNIRQEFLLDYLSKRRPATVADFLYEAYNSKYRLKSLPVIAWKNPAAPIKAAIICVHGMGLENQAFSYFAKEMIARGFFVCAIDCRGFGSWLASPGSEKIMFGDTIKDIKFVHDLLKSKDESLPIFLLGESMGGAIALRAAAKYDQDFAGVIASVPSAERFQEKRMALDVALHFLKNSSKPYAMMETITQQATARPTLLASWTEDSKAKMKVSPRELLDFSIFMRRTEAACKKIEKTPTFIVQGLKDALVKPRGTFKMFEHVKSPDKDMFILGTAEHLIFESDLQCQMLLNTLNTWLTDHAVAKTTEAGSGKTD